MSPARPPEGARAAARQGEGTPVSLSRTPVLGWAALGLVVTLFSLVTVGRWWGSADQFMPVVLTPELAMPAAGVHRIRLLEAVSSAIAVAALCLGLLRPWWRSGQAPIQGLVMVGALVSYVFDTTVNYDGYVMAWNVHSLNFGTWAAFFPGHSGPVRYAEALLWGPPMYVYFGVVLGSIQWAVFRAGQRALGRWPAALLGVAVAFMLDMLAEVFIIHATEAYAWARVVGALSLWPGTQGQFPLDESLWVAVYSSLYVLLLSSAARGGESFVERGVGRLPRATHLPVRALAAVGFASVPTLVYFTGFYAFSRFADTAAPLPVYLLSGG